MKIHVVSMTQYELLEKPEKYVMKTRAFCGVTRLWSSAAGRLPASQRTDDWNQSTGL